MPPNKPQSNYSKRPIKRVRLLKIGPRNTKGLLEEYFYAFLVTLTIGVAILGKAGGLSGYDAAVMGLWVGGFAWFAWQLKNYSKEKSKTALEKNPARIPEAPFPGANGKIVLPPGMKPMIGPQWPLKTGPAAFRPLERPAQTPARPAQPGASPAAPSSPNKPAFVYERPTLPDRKPKLPNNWPGQQNKKPKR
jgi:hypothetical protein